MNLQLPSEHQRLFVLIGVGVIALAGLFLVTRSGGGESTGTPSPPAKAAPAKPDPAKTSTQQSTPQKSSTAKSSPSKTTPSKSSPSKSTPPSPAATSRPAVKPSKQAYLGCVEQATDTAALEKCQALVP